MSLQIHSCIQTRCKRGAKGESLQNYKYGFSYKMRSTYEVNTLGIRYKYALRHKEDENVVPYVPDLLVAWRGHLNVLFLH